MIASLVRTPEKSLEQPGGRAPAPGDLAVLQAFVNTFWDLENGDEMFWAPRDLAAWLADHGLASAKLRATEKELTRALQVREGLRALMFRNNGSERPVPESLVAPVAISLAVGGRPTMAPAAETVEGALGVLLGIAAVAMLDGTWPRLKACPGDHCGWAFYDHSRNQAGTWCSMKVCGGRAKARAYYRRSRG
jgi:predicted RNA-binding Zn ribbon-like protein